MRRDNSALKMKAGFLAGWCAGFRASRLDVKLNRAAFAGFMQHGRTAAQIVLHGLDSFAADKQHAIEEMVAFYDAAFADYERDKRQTHGGSENAGTESQDG